ncbi:conserved hypothetical protein [Oleispira antarctica RB-8]|uniref:Uncharacterized protein n=1 Tax=Oleispira antarctica RB-8 TaxID=698738 RepID=R4YR86_OLEAN|nr:conserved hypothetical protein [Oleispira antarctica RB-8]
MNIEELLEHVYEDLNGQITSVDSTGGLVVNYECDDWNDYGKTRKFIITCVDVKESDIREFPSGDIDFLSEHQLLWNHNEPHGYLYYSSEPKNRYEILGRVWEAHELALKGWRPLTDYANTYHAGQFIEFCKDSNGLLARGPKPILEKYRKAIAGLVTTNYVPSYTPDGGYKALIFDDGFVICKSVVVVELGCS